jgi:hypothetical protein
MPRGSLLVLVISSAHFSPVAQTDTFQSAFDMAQRVQHGRRERPGRGKTGAKEDEMPTGVSLAEAGLIHAYRSAADESKRAAIIRRYAEINRFSVGRAEDELDLWVHMLAQQQRPGADTPVPRVSMVHTPMEYTRGERASAVNEVSR